MDNWKSVNTEDAPEDDDYDQSDITLECAFTFAEANHSRSVQRAAPPYWTIETPTTTRDPL